MDMKDLHSHSGQPSSQRNQETHNIHTHTIHAHRYQNEIKKTQNEIPPMNELWSAQEEPITFSSKV